MSRWSDRDDDRRDEERREYRADVFYEAWRSGIDPDRAVNCAEDCYYDGRSAQECVAGTAAEIRREREHCQSLQEEAWEQESAAYEAQQCEAEPEPEQQPDIDAFLGEGRKPVRSLASVMVPSARDLEQQSENDPHMLCVCGHAVVEHTCANDDCGCLAFKRAATAPSEQQPDSDARNEVAK